MPVELENKTDGSIHVRDMKDGQIGVITLGIFEGEIVQRLENSIISIGRTSGKSWSNRIEQLNFRVQVIKNGTKLTITDNE